MRSAMSGLGGWLMRIGWPAFLAACLLELLVFAYVDPREVQLPGPLGESRQAVYTLAFFAFWLVSFAACALTVLLREPGRTATE